MSDCVRSGQNTSRMVIKAHLGGPGFGGQKPLGNSRKSCFLNGQVPPQTHDNPHRVSSLGTCCFFVYASTHSFIVLFASSGACVFVVVVNKLSISSFGGAGLWYTKEGKPPKITTRI